MKKLYFVLAIFLVVVLTQVTFAKQDLKSLKYSVKTVIDPDPPSSVRVLINDVWYIIVYDANGMPIEIIQAPIRN